MRKPDFHWIARGVARAFAFAAASASAADLPELGKQPKNGAPKPAYELRAFAKTRTLKPGESQAISVTLGPRELASSDETSSAWITKAGTYTVKVGASSEDVRRTATFRKAAQERIAPVSAAIAGAR